MIDVETLREGPETKSLPILTDKEVEQVLQRRIELVQKSVKEPIRLGSYRPPRTLFNISGDEEYPNVPDIKYGSTKGRKERARLQELALGVMAKFGFNPEKFEPDKSFGRNGVYDRADGTTVELLIFPSEKIPGLIFRRLRNFYTKTGETYDVSWEVEDTAPAFRLDLGRALRGK